MRLADAHISYYRTARPVGSDRAAPTRSLNQVAQCANSSTSHRGAASRWPSLLIALNALARTASRQPIAASSASNSPLMTSTVAGSDVNQVMD